MSDTPGGPLSVPRLRLVWAAVTAHPAWSLRRLATALGIGFGDIEKCLKRLEAAGYIVRSGKKHCAVEIIVPFHAPYERLPRTAQYPFSDVANPANFRIRPAKEAA